MQLDGWANCCYDILHHNKDPFSPDFIFLQPGPAFFHRQGGGNSSSVSVHKNKTPFLRRFYRKLNTHKELFIALFVVIFIVSTRIYGFKNANTKSFIEYWYKNNEENRQKMMQWLLLSKEKVNIIWEKINATGIHIKISTFVDNIKNTSSFSIIKTIIAAFAISQVKDFLYSIIITLHRIYVTRKKFSYTDDFFSFTGLKRDNTTKEEIKLHYSIIKNEIEDPLLRQNIEDSKNEALQNAPSTSSFKWNFYLVTFIMTIVVPVIKIIIFINHQ